MFGLSVVSSSFFFLSMWLIHSNFLQHNNCILSNIVMFSSILIYLTRSNLGTHACPSHIYYRHSFSTEGSVKRFRYVLPVHTIQYLHSDQHYLTLLLLNSNLYCNELRNTCLNIQQSHLYLNIPAHDRISWFKYFLTQVDMEYLQY